MDENRIGFAEIALLQFFSNCADIERAYNADSVISAVKAQGCYKSEIKEARKRLGVASVKTDTGQRWLWASIVAPKDVLEQKMKEVTEGC